MYAIEISSFFKRDGTGFAPISTLFSLVFPDQRLVDRIDELSRVATHRTTNPVKNRNVRKIPSDSDRRHRFHSSPVLLTVELVSVLILARNLSISRTLRCCQTFSCSCSNFCVGGST
ncbi:hypothetical protein RB195_003830 [Necator americanus]|uniref:Uncharacterized protein n=1 Tax=Necator americanus TaxID=51031 RepID=A0ABR1DQF2_NECAM